MQLLPIQTRRIEPGDDLLEIIREGMKELGVRNEELDIFVISSKAAATAEGNVIDLSTLTPGKEADYFAEKCGRSPAFCEAVLQEVKKRNGRVRGTCPGAILTELKPWSAVSSRVAPPSLDTPSASGLGLLGMTRRRVSRDDSTQHDTMGVIFTANAGLDESNVPKNTAIGWPEDPVRSARGLRDSLMKFLVPHFDTPAAKVILSDFVSPSMALRTGSASKIVSKDGRATQCDTASLAIIISDSCVRPRRWGVTAYALTVAGFDPLRDEAGREDLYQRKLRITKEAIADQLATAANMLMGNADQAIPAVIIRDHGIPFSDFVGWVPGIEPAEDLFQGMI